MFTNACDHFPFSPGRETEAQRLQGSPHHRRSAVKELRRHSQGGVLHASERCLLVLRTCTAGFDLGSSMWMHRALWELAPQGNRAMKEKRMRMA